MKKWFLLPIALVLVVGVLVLSGCTSQPSFSGIFSNQQEGIWVTGTGKVTVDPDIVNLSLGIEAQESSVALAQSEAAEAMNRVMDALTDNGVAKKDIQTQRYSISQVTRWDSRAQQQIIVGYRVTNMVTAKIRDLDKAGTIIDAVAEAGGDLTRVNGIYFSIDDPSIYHKEARERAMEDAEAKAKQLAGLGNVSLGKPTYISESLYVPSPIIRTFEAAAAPAPTAPTPISPGEMDVTVSVQVTYAIK